MICSDFSNCDGVVVPRLENEIKGKEQEFCPRCKCSYEIRNTAIIKASVIFRFYPFLLS